MLVYQRVTSNMIHEFSHMFPTFSALFVGGTRQLQQRLDLPEARRSVAAAALGDHCRVGSRQPLRLGRLCLGPWGRAAWKMWSWLFGDSKPYRPLVYGTYNIL